MWRGGGGGSGGGGSGAGVDLSHHPDRGARTDAGIKTRSHPADDFFVCFFLKASAVRSEKCAPGGTAAFKAVRGDVAEMWLPVRRSAPHLRTRRSHTAPWIDPG